MRSFVAERIQELYRGEELGSVDGDGMLELITEYDQSYIKIIEIDERREKW